MCKLDNVLAAEQETCQKTPQLLLVRHVFGALSEYFYHANFLVETSLTFRGIFSIVISPLTSYWILKGQKRLAVLLFTMDGYIYLRSAVSSVSYICRLSCFIGRVVLF